MVLCTHVGILPSVHLIRAVLYVQLNGQLRMADKAEVCKFIFEHLVGLA